MNTTTIEVELFNNDYEQFPKGTTAKVQFESQYLTATYDTKKRDYNEGLGIWEDEYMFETRIVARERIGGIHLQEFNMERHEGAFYAVICHTDIKHCLTFQFNRLKKANQFLEKLMIWRFGK